jgi:phosphatidylserine/phosphatidylglycerophosphate/cardiolipin synthase-like enzyme
MRLRPFALGAFLTLVAAPAWAQPSATPPGLVVAPVGSGTSVHASAYFQPFGDAESAALDVLARARKSVHVAHYNVRNSRFYDALVALRARGLDVQMVSDAKEAAQPWNWLTQDFIKAGFNVLLFQPPTNPNAIMHLKTAIVDGETVMTGSYNWNNTAQLSNDENVLVVHDAAVAQEYERYFQHVQQNKITAWKPLLPKGSPVEVHFSPGDRPDITIQNLIDGAKDRVTVAMFTLTDKFVAEKLQKAAKRGVSVEVVVEAKQVPQSAQIAPLASAGCRVIIGANQASAFSAMHHKYAVIDDVVVTGACNWTKTAFLQSCEDVIVVRDAGLARTYRHNWKALRKRYDAFNYDPFQFGIATPDAHVQLVVENDRTQWGDRVVVTGNCPELGDWDPAKGKELRTSDDVFPRWSASVAVPAGHVLEYKFVVVKSDGYVAWEEGANHSFTVDAQGTDEARFHAFRHPVNAP